MDPVFAILTFAHIAGGAIWLGASAFANVVVIPFIAGQPLDRRSQLVQTLVLGPERLIVAAALTAGLSGLALGVVYRGFGTSTPIFGPGGLVWLASILVAFVVFGAGGRLTSPAARSLAAATGDGAADTGLGRLRIGFLIELVGILLILALMVILARA